MTNPQEQTERIRLWWTLISSMARDTAATVVGIWILLVKDNPSMTLEAIGFLCLTLSAAGAAKKFGEVFGIAKDKER